jgi:hypothetical protein
MLLPLAVVPLVSFLKFNPKLLSASIIFVMVTFAIPKIVVYYPISHLTEKRPIEIKKLALWLERSAYRNEPVLMTWIGEQSSYLPIYFPDIGPHDEGHFILRRAVLDSRLEKYMKKRRPSLLITCDADYNFISRIERVLGKKLELGDPVYSENHVKVYDIKYLFRS